jgi:DNA replication protein DnaC
VSTTAPKPPPICSVPGCRKECERFGGFAPVLEHGRWRERAFCSEHRDQAWEKARQIKLAALRKPHPRMRDWTLDTFPADDPAGAAAHVAAREWLGDPGDDFHGTLFIFGPVGSGKTGLAWSLAVALQDRWPDDNDRFVNVRQMLAEVRHSFATDEPVDPTEELIDVNVLVLDDLGAERVTDWTREMLATIVEGRYVRNDVATIVTSNYAPSELAQRLGHDDPVLGLRIVSRLTETGMQIRLVRPDLRTRVARIA